MNETMLFNEKIVIFSYQPRCEPTNDRSPRVGRLPSVMVVSTLYTFSSRARPILFPPDVLPTPENRLPAGPTITIFLGLYIFLSFVRTPSSSFKSHFLFFLDFPRKHDIPCYIFIYIHIYLYICVMLIPVYDHLFAITMAG